MRKIYCSNCGQLVPANAHFCPYCGAPQHGPEAGTYQIEHPAVHHGAAAFVLAQAQQPPAKKTETKEHGFTNRKLAGAARIVFFFSYIAKTFPILIALGAGVVLEPTIFGILIVSYIFTLVLIAFAVHDSFRYSITKFGFEMEYGILHTEQVSVPFNQIENVNIVRDSFDQIAGLARIDIETAGNANDTPRNIIGGQISQAEAHLPGVTLSDAKLIHDLLIERMTAHKG